ncbi:hypothetical protein OJAV_G00006540 [Oryzias javanicus]|uniref:Uncharacterized protein n=1 Tax=Oryzias javanicus TaxID=123683 RepID=A0A437DMJ4_ORYJA|nr:hypothetical protein OJAV_G00006540 [Oryzias javanicus]
MDTDNQTGLDNLSLTESPRCVADSSNETATATHQDPEGACGEETGPSTEPEQGNERASGTDTEVGVANTKPSVRPRRSARPPARPRTSARPRPRTDPVTLYHNYRVYWENFKRPWDRARSRLRDELRKSWADDLHL